MGRDFNKRCACPAWFAACSVTNTSLSPGHGNTFHRRNLFAHEGLSASWLGRFGAEYTGSTLCGGSEAVKAKRIPYQSGGAVLSVASA